MQYKNDGVKEMHKLLCGHLSSRDSCESRVVLVADWDK